RISVDDVEFGDLDCQAEARYPGEEPAQARRGKRRPPHAWQMGLNTHRIDRRPRLNHTLEQTEQRDTACFVIEGVELETLLVDGKQRAGIRLPRGMMS